MTDTFATRGHTRTRASRKRLRDVEANTGGLLEQETDVPSMLRLAIWRFYRAMKRHQEPYDATKHPNLAWHLNGTCPHLRDRMRLAPLWSFGPELDLGFEVYLHANAPGSRYCLRCSKEARRNFGDGHTCATCQRIFGRRMRTLELNVQEHKIATHVWAIVPICESCQSILRMNSTQNQELAND